MCSWLEKESFCELAKKTNHNTINHKGEIHGNESMHKGSHLGVTTFG